MFYDFMLRDVFNSFVYGKPETDCNSARPIRIRTGSRVSNTVFASFAVICLVINTSLAAFVCL